MQNGRRAFLSSQVNAFTRLEASSTTSTHPTSHSCREDSRHRRSLSCRERATSRLSATRKRGTEWYVKCITGSQNTELTAVEQRQTSKASRTIAPSTFTDPLARKKVLATVELLENIIVQIPGPDIFVVNRVSRHFRDTIVGSSKIQEKLFNRSHTSRQLWYLCSISTPPRPSPRDDKGLYWRSYDPANGDAVGEFVPVRLCGFLTVPAPLQGQPDTTPHLKVIKTAKLRCTEFDEAKRAQGVWRDVQLTDPPCNEVFLNNVSLRITARSPQRIASLDRVRLVVPGGITLGDVVDKACTTSTSLVTISETLQGERRDHHWSSQRLTIDQLRGAFKHEQREQNVHSALYVDVELIGMVIPTQEEWDSVGKEGVSS